MSDVYCRGADSRQTTEDCPSDLDSNTLPLDEAQNALSALGPAVTLIDAPTKRSGLTDITGAELILPPTPASSPSHRGSSVPIFKPIPEVPHEHLAETSAIEEIPQHAASPAIQAPSTASTGEGGSGDRGHANTLPRKYLVTGSYPTRDDAAHVSQRITLPSNDLYSRSLTAPTAKQFGTLA